MARAGQAVKSPVLKKRTLADFFSGSAVVGSTRMRACVHVCVRVCVGAYVCERAGARVRVHRGVRGYLWCLHQD